VDHGDGLSIDRWFFPLSLSLHLLSRNTSLKNVLEEAITAKLDLKCCLEAGALRDDENGERETEESLRAKVESIRRKPI